MTPKRKDLEMATFSGKNTDHTVELLVACTVLDGKVCYVSETKEGKYGESNMLSDVKWQTWLDEGEYLTDKGFGGKLVLHKWRKKKQAPLTEISLEENKTFDRFRIVIENCFCWAKKFRICSDSWRVKTQTKAKEFEDFLLKHNKIWRIVICMEQKFHKVRKNK